MEEVPIKQDMPFFLARPRPRPAEVPQMPQSLATGCSSARGRRSRRSRWLYGSLGALLLSGCTTFSEYIHNGFMVGPNYSKPPAPLAKDWIDANDVRVRKDPQEQTHWWTVFNDPVLDSLVCDA